MVLRTKTYRTAYFCVTLHNAVHLHTTSYDYPHYLLYYLLYTVMYYYVLVYALVHVLVYVLVYM